MEDYMEKIEKATQEMSYDEHCEVRAIDIFADLIKSVTRIVTRTPDLPCAREVLAESMAAATLHIEALRKKYGIPVGNIVAYEEGISDAELESIEPCENLPDGEKIWFM